MAEAGFRSVIPQESAFTTCSVVHPNSLEGACPLQPDLALAYVLSAAAPLKRFGTYHGLTQVRHISLNIFQKYFLRNVIT